MLLRELPGGVVVLHIDSHYSSTVQISRLNSDDVLFESRYSFIQF